MYLLFIKTYLGFTSFLISWYKERALYMGYILTQLSLLLTHIPRWCAIMIILSDSLSLKSYKELSTLSMLCIRNPHFTDNTVPASMHTYYICNSKDCYSFGHVEKLVKDTCQVPSNFPKL